PFSRQMCSDLNRICRLEPASRQMCSNLNRICHLERLCPYNCVKEKSHSHPHDTIILDQQNFVGGNENDSTQFYLKLRRTKRTKSELGDVTKSMLVLLLNDYMEKERDGYMGDYAYERSDDRHDYRNGYYDRPYFLSIGKIDLKVPRTRSGEFSTDVFEKYER